MAIDTQAIDKNTSKLRSLVKNSSKLLTGKQVHRLRTRTRRIEAILDALQLNKKRNERRLLRSLAAVRKKAGKVRDMDVLTDALSKVELNGDNKSAVPLLEFLGEERQHRAKKLRQALAKNGPEIRRRLKRTESRLLKLIAGDANGSPQATKAQPKKKVGARRHEMTSEARAKIAEAIVRMSDELAAPSPLNQSNLHKYRKSVKKLRYVLQAATEHANDALVKDLGKCKDVIGEWHDWDELVNIAHDVAQHDDSVREAVKRLVAIRQQKFESALSFTNAMRAKYVQFEPTKRAHPSHRGSAHDAPPKNGHHATPNGHRQRDAALHLATSVTEPTPT